MRHLIRIAFIVLSSISLVHAGTTGKIAGKVTDISNGEPLVGANVLVKGTNLGAAADIKGNYNILNIPPGIYTLKVSVIGYKELNVENVRISVDLTTTVNLELEQTDITGEVVTVVAERPRVRPDITSTQAIISAEEIEVMPVEEFERVIELKAGVVTGTGGELHVRGGRSGEITYLIDGVPVTDSYSKSMGVEIENAAISELQLISGTFNAEYGQAQSAVINIVTKDGSLTNYNGQIDFYLGDYYTTDTTLFPHNDKLELKGVKDFQANLSGPVLQNRLSFFAFGRYKDSEGFHFGERKYKPDSFYYNSDSSDWVPTRVSFDTTFFTPDSYLVDTIKTTNFGDGEIVPMNSSTQWSGEMKFTLALTPKIKLKIGGRASKTEYKTYSHKFRYNPDGDYTYYQENDNLIIAWDQSISSSSFFNLRYSHLYNSVRYYNAENPLDPTAYVVDPSIFSDFSGYRFYVGGTVMGHFRRHTEGNLFKGDWVAQLTNEHKIQMGFQYKRDKVSYESFSVLNELQSRTEFRPFVPYPTVENYETSPAYNRYEHKPSMFGLYIQDKMEYYDIVLNLGLRYERFQPDGQLPSDPGDTNILDPLKPVNQAMTLAERSAIWYKEATVKEQWSPRIGVGHKISDRGSIHFSYGHFLQMPSYAKLYANPDFEVSSGASTTMGNADLDPERTVKYDVGIQQELADGLTLDLTGFYQDVRGLIDREVHENFIGDKYWISINRDYSNIRGISMTFTKVGAQGVTGTLDYTYSVAEGNASDPSSAYFDELAGREPEKQLVYLNWDQAHTLNVTVGYNKARNYGVNVIGNYGSGLPYTPSFRGLRTAFENSDRRPVQYNVDMRAYRRFDFGRIKTTLYLNVYNVFDIRNERLVFSDTGRANYTLIPTYTPQTQGRWNTLDEYLIRPDYYSAPRSFKLGIRFAF